MALYNVKDLLSQLAQIASDGYEYVDIFESSGDEEAPDSIQFSALESGDFFVDYDSVDSVNVPEDYDFQTSPHSCSPDAPCTELIFSYNEMFILKHAVDNALEYFKEEAANPEYSRKIRDQIKSSSIDIRNIQAKLNQLISHLEVK